MDPWAFLLAVVIADTPPASLAPPSPARLVMRASADGVQVYACESVHDAFEWVFKVPEAALFDETGLQIGKHFAGPSWQSFDGSLVTGEVVSKVAPPSPGTIPWLLLRAKTHSGAGRLASVSYIQRTQTKGGVAPSSGCDSEHLGAEARIRYSADYTFYSDAP